MDIFDLLLIAFALIASVAIIIYAKHQKRPRKKIMAAASEPAANKHDRLFLSSLRNMYFDDIAEYTNFHIPNYILEAFNVFMELNITVLTTINKISKRLIDINATLTNNNSAILVDNLKADLESILNAINQMNIITNTLDKQIEAISSGDLDKNFTALDVELVHSYMNTVNMYQAISDTYSDIIFNIQREIDSSYPELSELNKRISSNMTYLLYSILSNEIITFNESIIASK